MFNFCSLLSGAGRAGLLGLALTLGTATAADARVLRIEAPVMVKAGVNATATIVATSAGDKERVGFLHAEVSTDGGKTWAPLCYLDNGAAREVRRVTLPAGDAGSTLTLRARAAFRGGPAGDVDFRGEPIKWEESWGKWTEPPARHLTISVRK